MFSFLKKSALGKRIRSLFGARIGEEELERLEQLFFEADLGSALASSLTEKIRLLSKKDPDLTPDQLLESIRKEMRGTLLTPPPLHLEHRPTVILIVGVNGNGKTTSIAKLAHHFAKQGKKVLIAAGDTFRAAATEQLETWVARAGVELVKAKMGSDPAALAFDALTAALHRGHDVLLIDTAGRLHTKEDLMEELAKIRRVCNKALLGAPHETWLILDATLGQNSLAQAQMFHKYTPLTGLILTKIDGTAKGGAAFAIQKSLNIPIRYLGTGEGLEDLEPFDPEAFSTALFAG